MAAIPLSKDEVECSPAKKFKTETENASKDTDSIHETEICLSTFEVRQVLHNNCSRKQVFVEGTFKGREGSTVIILEKRNFSDDKSCLKEELFNEDTILRKNYSNDIYGNYECFPLKNYNGML